MKKSLLAASAAVAALALTAVAVAQEPDAARPHHGPGRMIFHSDANQDGVITRVEFDAERSSAFTRLDANADGNITREERSEQMRALRAEHGGPGGHEGGGREGGRHGGHRGLERADANNDGSITRDEFLARPVAHFEHLDANHDGVISIAERPQPRERGARGERFNPDANNDGAISRAEFDVQSSALFTRLDANSDGRVTREEAEAARPHRGGPRPAQ